MKRLLAYVFVAIPRNEIIPTGHFISEEEEERQSAGRGRRTGGQHGWMNRTRIRRYGSMREKKKQIRKARASGPSADHGQARLDTCDLLSPLYLVHRFKKSTCGSGCIAAYCYLVVVGGYVENFGYFCMARSLRELKLSTLQPTWRASQRPGHWKKSTARLAHLAGYRHIHRFWPPVDHWECIGGAGHERAREACAHE